MLPLLETNYKELKKMDAYPDALKKFLEERDERIQKQKEDYQREKEMGKIGASSETASQITEEDRAVVQAGLTHRNRAVQMAAKAAWDRLPTN